MAYNLKTSKAKEEKLHQVKGKPYSYKITREKVYSYQNLPEESKQKAIENYYDINVSDTDWWYDDYLLDLGLTNKNSKADTLFSWDKIYFSLDRANYLQFEKLKVNDDDAFRQELGVSKKTWSKITYDFDNSGRNSDTRFTYYENEDLNDDDIKQLDKAEEKFAQLVDKAKSNLSKNYDYQTSREAIVYTFEANEYQFTENGRIA